MQSKLIASISEILDAQQVQNGAFVTPVPGLRVLRTFGRVAPRPMSYRPSLCVVAQGAKQTLVGETSITYGAMQTLVVTIDVPVLSQILEASPEEPFIGATLDLEPEIIRDVVTQLDSSHYAHGNPGFGLVVNDMDAQITAAVIRLLELIGRPQAIDILFPAIMREIAYWLLTGPAGRSVARMVLPTGQPQRIAKAIQHLREHFDAPMNVGELASIANMSTSSFHEHFKTLTSMSPLQYQKHLRLLEARRRMVTDGEKAGVAAFSVGYESVSQFSREYARMFGSPPRRDTRNAAVLEALINGSKGGPVALTA
jgi:AraC-like DNA-binding protein